LETFRKAMEKPVESISPEAVRRLESYDWPGNVRELENTMERAVALETSGEITLRVLPDRIAGYSGSQALASSNGASAFPEQGVHCKRKIAEPEPHYPQAPRKKPPGPPPQPAHPPKTTSPSFRHYAKKHNLYPNLLVRLVFPIFRFSTPHFHRRNPS